MPTKIKKKPQNIKKTHFPYFESGKNKTKKDRENKRHVEESTSTDNDSLQSQPQPSYNSKNVTEIANEWNTTTSLSEGESPSKTSSGKSVSKSFKRLKKIFQDNKTPVTQKTPDEKSILDIEMVTPIP